MTVYLTISFANRERVGWTRVYRDGKMQQLSHHDEEGNERRYERTEGRWTLSVYDPGGNLLRGPSWVPLPRDGANASS